MNSMLTHHPFRSSRSGKKLGAWEISQGLKACYGLTTPFAIFLSYTTFFLLRKNPLGSIDLYDIGKHGPVEHDASLVHHDTPAGEEYAPIDIDLKLVDEVVADAQTVVEEEVEVEVDGKKEKQKVTTTLYSTEDVGRSRVRREKLSPPLSSKAAEVARGEVAIILGVWEKKVGDKKGAPIDWIKQWLSEERLPEGWSAKPGSFGLKGTRERAKAIKAAAEAIRAKEEKEKGEQVKEKGEQVKEKGDAPPVAAADATKAS
jgi:Peroxidase, family 2